MSTGSAKAFATGNQIKDYLIGELLCEGTHTETWRATQVSVQREVVVVSLKGAFVHDPASVEAFLSDVRTKASVEHPLIGAIFEVVHSDEYCFFSREKLSGKSLEEHHQDGLRISPLMMARIIRGLAHAFKYIESKGVATHPLTPNDLFLDDQLYCRMVNMVVAGEADPSVFTRDKQLLGSLLRDFLEPNQPGSTRMGSLLDYMADTNREIPLTWNQIYDLSDEVEHQLAETKKQMLLQSSTVPMKPRISEAMLLKVALALIVSVIVVGLTYYIATRKNVSQEKPPLEKLQHSAPSAEEN